MSDIENPKPSAINSQIPVLWADEALLVINKPAGLRTLPDGYDPSAAHLRGLLEPVYGRLWIVHRLDKDTSGILLLARSTPIHRILNTQFEQHQVVKVYHALVEGNPQWEVYTTDLPLRPDGDRHHRTVVDSRGGKAAVTHFRLLERFTGYALLEARPETGRTHQIRAHLAALRLPVAGDDLYGGGKSADLLIERPLLHAWSLDFAHPGNGEALHLKAPYPEDFMTVLARLRLANP